MTAAVPPPAPPQAGPGPRKRLGLAIGLALLAHLVLVFAVGFALDTPKPPPRALEVTLATFRSEQPPEKTDFIAQDDQQGSGSQQEKLAPRTNEETLFQDSEIRKVTPAAAPPPARQPEPARRVVTTRAPAREKLPAETPHSKPAPESQPAPRFDSARLSAEIASLEAELSEDIQRYAKSPRISRQNSASTRRDVSAWYRDEWRKKVERIGNLNYPAEARRLGIYGSLRLLVTLNRDGAVTELKILESSGQPILDSAALRIVRLAAPFAPFTGELARQYDQVEIIRTWRFLHGDRLSGQ